MPKSIVVSVVVGLVLGVTAFLLVFFIPHRGAPRVPASPAPVGDSAPVRSIVPQESTVKPDLPFEVRESPAPASQPETPVPESDEKPAPMDGMRSRDARQPTGESLPPEEVTEVSPQTPPLPTPTQTAKLVVRSHPRAKVFVDGEYRGLTPLDLDLPKGSYVVLLRTEAPPEDEFTTTVELFPSQVEVIEQDFGSGWWRFH